MQNIEVQASRCYTVHIAAGALSRAGECVREVTKAETAVVVTDDIVNALYGDRVVESLQAEGFRTLRFVFPNGEASKNLTVLGELLEYLAENHVTRSDCIVALGGGVVGDLAGFAAAVYQRGIDFVQVPTTLLACVDSSVGGKTAVDLTAGKNLAGAFYQPKAVLCDYETLSTLPDAVFADGMAEVIKYGAAFDRAFFDFLKLHNARENLETVIARCIELKRDIVAEDETDRGRRGLLNFGHTLGHAIEGCSRFAVSHGSAVGIGMVMMSRAAYKSGLTKADCSDEIAALLRQYGLPTKTAYAAEALCEKALSDKKRSGSHITLVIPETLGHCVLHTVETAALLPIIQKGLEA